MHGVPKNPLLLHNNKNIHLLLGVLLKIVARNIAGSI